MRARAHNSHTSRNNNENKITKCTLKCVTLVNEIYIENSLKQALLRHTAYSFLAFSYGYSGVREFSHD